MTAIVNGVTKQQTHIDNIINIYIYIYMNPEREQYTQRDLKREIDTIQEQRGERERKISD